MRRHNSRRKLREAYSHGNDFGVEAVLRNRQTVVLQRRNIAFDCFFYVGDCLLLACALRYASGKAGALGYPKTILAAINQDLTHR